MLIHITRHIVAFLLGFILSTIPSWGASQDPTSSSTIDLFQYFQRIAVKRLNATDIDPAISRQHEIVGVKALQDVFGTKDLRLRGRLLYYGEQVFSTDVDLTWYNARKSGQPLYRLYYRDNPVTKAARPGDALVVARYGNDEVLAIVTPENSRYEKQLFSLLKIEDDTKRSGIDILNSEDSKISVTKVIREQLQQTGKVPVEVSIWKDVKTGEISIEGKVEKVKDGDTLNISGVFDVRLFGIDTPEHNQNCIVDGKEWNCGQEALRHLSSLVLGKKISCSNQKKEKYSRYLSVCKVNGQDINKAMIKKGLAIIYYSNKYALEERKARVKRQGLWNSEFINPEDYRRGKRN